MGPKDFSAHLRQIASRIENSKKPSRELVARDIRGLLTRLAQEEQQEQQAPVAQQQQGQQEQQALPKSKPGKQMVMEALEHLNSAAQADDEEGFKKAFDALQKAAKV